MKGAFNQEKALVPSPGTVDLSEGSLTALVLGGGAGRGEAAQVEEAWQAQVAVPRRQPQRGAGQSGVSI